MLTAFGGLPAQGEPWIIDSGALDHMTGCEKFFSSYVLSPDNHKVKIADGSFTVVAGVGTIELSPRIMLKGILHVLNLSCNLLSISKITKDLQRVVYFTPSLCVFQKQHSGKKIGNTRELSGLYYFENSSSVGGHVKAVVTDSTFSRHQKIILLYFRLGHPRFLYLKRLFPSLFCNIDSFQCEVCPLAKRRRVYLPPQPYRASKPFTLIHSDICGPNRIRTFSNKQWFISFVDDHTRACWVFL